MQEIITNQTLAPLSDVTVIKRGQTKTPFTATRLGWSCGPWAPMSNSLKTLAGF